MNTDSMQPGSPPDTGEEGDSHGLGPAVRPEPAPDDGLRWFPIPGKPGIEISDRGTYRTVIPTPEEK